MNKFDIAQGVRVYYNNRKEEANTVFTSDGEYHYYADGDMLRELISDEAFYLMSEKVMIAIDTFPEGNRQISVESITDAFRWIYGMLGSEELPLTREIVRGMISDKINGLAAEMSLDEGLSVSEFMHQVYRAYAEDLKTFAIFIDALAFDGSNAVDPFQKEVVRIFEEAAEEPFEEYSRKCSARVDSSGKNVKVEIKELSSFMQVLFFEYCRLNRLRKPIKICENCGQFFIPTGRRDTKYCDRESPYNPGKSCKDVGAENKRQMEISADDNLRENRNAISRYRMAAKRARENGEDYLLDGYERMIDKAKRDYEKKAAEGIFSEQPDD